MAEEKGMTGNEKVPFNSHKLLVCKDVISNCLSLVLNS